MSEMLFEGDATSLSHGLVILLALKNLSIYDKNFNACETLYALH